MSGRYLGHSSIRHTCFNSSGVLISGTLSSMYFSSAFRSIGCRTGPAILTSNESIQGFNYTRSRFAIFPTSDCLLGNSKMVRQSMAGAQLNVSNELTISTEALLGRANMTNVTNTANLCKVVRYVLTRKTPPAIRVLTYSTKFNHDTRIQISTSTV